MIDKSCDSEEPFNMPITYEKEKAGRILTWRRGYVEFPPHFHRTIELVAVVRGSCRAYVDFAGYDLGKGDIFVAFPNRIHSYSDEKDIDCYTFLFPADICPALSGVFDTKKPVCPVIKAGEHTEHLFECIERIYCYNPSNDFYKKQIARGYFSVLLPLILSAMMLEDAPTGDPSTERRIIDYCMENFRSPLTLETLSKDLYISRHHISHLFSSKLKVGFNDFINQIRIRDACTRLENGAGITEAAYASGFCSIRTFNRAFIKDRAMTPTDYIKNIKS